MEFFLEFDYWLFGEINSLSPTGPIEKFILLLREKYLWIPFYIFVITFILFNFNLRVAISKIITIAATIGLTDYVGNNLFKKGFERLRPCNNTDLDFSIIERIECSSSFSFTSNHAANHFAIAMILILLLPSLKSKIKIPLILWAAAISFAQVFAGVHYPSDVLGGAALGILIAFCLYKILLRIGYLSLDRDFQSVN